MNITHELLVALESGETHETLLRRLHDYESKGLASKELYRVLEQIWLEHGFGAKDGGGSLREDLEFIMEKLWFQGVH
jgi:hypothetical protein